MEQKHQFAVGDRVEWHAYPRNAAHGGYLITRLLPPDAEGIPQYRMRSDAEIAERFVSQDAIRSNRRWNTQTAG